MFMRRLLFFLPAALAACALVALSQQATQTNDSQTKPSKDQKQDPAPLFGGQIGAKSSKSTKESATLGFNGIDPSGKVEQRMLNSTPSSSDTEKVRNMDAAKPAPTEVAAFIQQGGLKSR